MITIQKVLKIKQELVDSEHKDMAPRQLTALRNKYKFWDTIHRYLTSNPTEEFVKKQLAEVKNRLLHIYRDIEQGEAKFEHEPAKKAYRQQMEKEYKVPDLMKKKETLDIILENKK